MKTRLLDYLACPRCRGELSLEAHRQRGEEILAGTLACAACGAPYPIREGVPELFPEPLRGVEQETAQRFGYEWQTYSAITPAHEKQFLDWIAPVTPASFQGKLVLDAGCGKGRHLYYVSRYGPREVIGLELGPAARVAYEHTRDFPRVHVVRGDLLRPPLKAAFDYIYSVGVIHHLPEPARGILSLSRLLKPGGELSTWVYGREGNDWLVGLIDPLRRHLTRRMPLAALRLGCLALTVPLFVALKTLYLSPSRAHNGKRGRLFYQDYLSYIAPFGFEELQSIVFDHFLAPEAHYLRQEEVRTWYAQAGLEIRSQAWHNRNSWRTWGTAAGRI